MKLNAPRPIVCQPDDPSYRIIPLTQGKVVLVSTNRYAFLNQWNWFAEYRKKEGGWIACRKDYSTGKSRRITMHRVLLPDAVNVDHENGDTLDNRDDNLRSSTVKQNSRNRKKPVDNISGFKGVWWRRERQIWVATIRVDNRHIYLGSSRDCAIAARIYDRGAIRYFGDFARTNFPRSNYLPEVA